MLYFPLCINWALQLPTRISLRILINEAINFLFSNAIYLKDISPASGALQISGSLYFFHVPTNFSSVEGLEAFIAVILLFKLWKFLTPWYMMIWASKSQPVQLVPCQDQTDSSAFNSTACYCCRRPKFKTNHPCWARTQVPVNLTPFLVPVGIHAAYPQKDTCE